MKIEFEASSRIQIDQKNIFIGDFRFFVCCFIEYFIFSFLTTFGWKQRRVDWRYEDMNKK